MPVLTYTAEVWGVFEKNKFEYWDKTPTEKAHLRFCKAFLGVSRKASNLACRAEMGRFPLKIVIDKPILNYYFRLRDMNDGPLVKQAFIMSNRLWQKGHNSLHSYVHSLPKTYKLPENITKQSAFSPNYLNTMRAKFVEHWKHKLGNSTKLKLYSEIKLYYTPEKYLNIIKGDKLKQAICSLRISNHILLIEKGRYQVPKLPRDLRICPMCNDDIEDEVHFLCHSTSYEVPRKALYDKLNKKIKADTSVLPVNEITALILNPDTSSCY